MAAYATQHKVSLDSDTAKKGLDDGSAATGDDQANYFGYAYGYWETARWDAGPFFNASQATSLIEPPVTIVPRHAI